MGLRDRVRKTFKKKEGGSSSGGSTPSSSSDPIHYTGRTDIEYYKPDEIPRSKYRGRVDPEHKEKLEAFSFSDAFDVARRRSSQALSGIMSPGGTKSQSRRPSYMSQASRDESTSIASSTPAANDVVAAPSTQATSTSHTGAPLIRENSTDDTDVLNTGLSRRDTITADHRDVPEVRLQRQATSSDQPFTLEELEQAMTRATIRAEHEAPFRNSPAIAAY